MSLDRPTNPSSALSPYAHREPIFTSPTAEAEVRADYDTVLDQWPVSHDLTVVPTRLGQTNVLTCGPSSATDLVLLHGAGSHGMSLDLRHREIRTDLPHPRRGYARRSRPQRPGPG